MENGRITSRLTWPWIALAALASAWLLVFFVLTRIVGPLNSDEVYFSHIFWLTLHGKRPFLDFYSQHLPVYFALYDLVIPRPSGDNLAFVWLIRLSNIAVLAAYVGILFAVARRSAIMLLPLLLLLVATSRMIEVRTDTLGLLAFNAAWALLLVGKSRGSVAAATLLAIASVSFSARALVIGVGFGAALVWRAAFTRDFKSLIAPAALLGFAVLAGLGAYLIYPRYVQLLLDSTVFSPAGLLVRLTTAQRIFAVDRLPQILIALSALLLGVASVVKDQDRVRAGIVAIASLTQLLLIFADPSPFPYVYAWTVIPSLVGLTLANELFGLDVRKWLGVGGAVGAAMIAAAILLYPMITGRQAPPGSNYRLLSDPPLSLESVRPLPLDALVQLMLSREHQQSLSNQLLVREELCRKVRGPVLSAWQSHPICVPDATYYWFSVKWPNMNVEGPPPAPSPWFEAMFRDHPPDLFIWDSGMRGMPVRLNPWAMSLLRNYDVEAGFAVRTGVARAATDSFDRAAIRPNNVRK